MRQTISAECKDTHRHIEAIDQLAEKHREECSLKESIVKNTTCLEKMVYSAIETTCFGL